MEHDFLNSTFRTLGLDILAFRVPCLAPIRLILHTINSYQIYMEITLIDRALSEITGENITIREKNTKDDILRCLADLFSSLILGCLQGKSINSA